MSRFCCSAQTTWGVLPEPRAKNYTANCLTHEMMTRKPYNDTLCLLRDLALHLLSKWWTWGRIFKNVEFFLKWNRMIWSNIFPRCLYERFLICVRLGSSRQLPKRHRHCGRSNDCVAGPEKCWQTFQNCSTFTLKQSILLCMQCQCVFSKPIVINQVISLFKKTGKLERHLTNCKERGKHIFSEKVSQLQETLFDKIDSFGMPHAAQQKLFNITVVLDFESVTVEDE